MRHLISQTIFEQFCGAYGGPIFLATGDVGETLDLHTTVKGDSARLRDTAARLGFSAIRVRLHSPSAIEAPRDLETLVSQLTGGKTIAFDPTGAIDQALGLVGFAKKVRAIFGGEINGICFDRARRVTIVSLKAGNRNEAEIRTLLEDAAVGETSIAVLVSYNFPIPGSVAIDRATAKAARQGKFGRSLKLAGGAALALLGVGVASAALATPLEGSLTAGESFGDPTTATNTAGQVGLVGPQGFVQVDAAAFNSSEANDFAGGGQAGFISPTSRLGAYGYAIQGGHHDTTALMGVFGEFYQKNMTFRVDLGTDQDSAVPSKDFVSGKVEVYFSDNMKGYVSGGTLDGGWGSVGVEAALSALPGLVVGAEYRDGKLPKTANISRTHIFPPNLDNGENMDNGSIYVRWFFRGAGEMRSLKDRDRTGLAESQLDEAAMVRAAALAHERLSYGNNPPP